MLFSKNYSISISEPCHEKWEDMNPAANGRFCNSCAKNVVDFTGMTEKEIIRYFRKKRGSTCGRFEASQLQKNYVVGPQIRLPFHQRFFSYILTFFVSNAFVSKATAQTDTTAIVHADTTAQIAGNDSVLVTPDSLAIGKEDTTGCVEDSLCLIQEIVEVQQPELITVISVTGCITSGDPWVSGSPWINVDKTLLFLDFLKTKYVDSLAVLKKTAGIVKEERIPAKSEMPETPEKPAKKDRTIASAVLPDELKRKGGKRA